LRTEYIDFKYYQISIIKSNLTNQIIGNITEINLY